jgi:hypothetical protein
MLFQNRILISAIKLSNFLYFLVVIASVQAEPLARPRPINAGEAIIDVLWDPQFNGISKWSVVPQNEYGLKAHQSWDRLTAEWNAKPKSGPVLHMSRIYYFDVTGYDKLIVSAVAGEGDKIRITALTDRGEIKYESVCPAVKKEHNLDLGGATVLKKLLIDLTPKEEGEGTAGFYWVGLADSRILARMEGQRQQLGQIDWEAEGYLKPLDYQPKFEPVLCIAITKKQLDQFREKSGKYLKEYGTTPLIENAKKITGGTAPEKMINEFVDFWNDKRYCRDRDYDKVLTDNSDGGMSMGPQAAMAGLVLKDKALLRLGARYSLSLAMCEYWDDGFITHFPGSSWSHRCFTQSNVTHDTAMVLDLAGELFTEKGRDFVLRRIAEEGMGSINYNTWAFEYIFSCNQLAWFSHGRILGYAVLERYYPRVKPYTEIAYHELLENIQNVILPDGGYSEGPMYMGAVATKAVIALNYFANARNLPVTSIIPEQLKRTADFAAVIISTDANADYIPFCDAVKTADLEYLAAMTSILPESQWAAMYRKALARQGGMAMGIISGHVSPANAPPLPAFVSLKDMGLAASHRKVQDQPVKILVIGNKAGATHTHEDKGSFVLEFAGDTFALDPGTASYSSALDYGIAQRHNMLVPAGLTERPGPANPRASDIKPQGTGDDSCFHVHVNVSPGWEKYYKTWERSWDSDRPDELTVTDEYTILKGDGVEFYWQTLLPVVIKGQSIIITGKKGKVIITAPADCKLRLDELSYYSGQKQHRIAICRPGMSGKISVQVRLELL